MLSPTEDDFIVKVQSKSTGKIETYDDYAVSEEHTINKVREERKTFFLHISVSIILSTFSFVLSILFLGLHVWQRYNQQYYKSVSAQDAQTFYNASAAFFACFAIFTTLFVFSILFCMGKTILLVLLAEHDRSLLKRKMADM